MNACLVGDEGFWSWVAGLGTALFFYGVVVVFRALHERTGI